MKPQPEPTAQSTDDPAAAIREQARRVRESRHDIDIDVDATVPPSSDEPADSIQVDTEESAKQTRRRMRGGGWEKLQPLIFKLLMAAAGGALGTGGGVAWQATRPPPSEVKLRELEEKLAAETAARIKLETDSKEDLKSAKDDSKESYKDLRELMFDQVNKPLNQRVNSLEAWQADQVREQERSRRRIQ